MTMEPKDAMVMGGCHVSGYGLDGAPPFWTDFVAARGAVAHEVHSHASIAKARRLLLSRAPLRPGTLVILQLGHHDVWKELAMLNPLTAFHARRNRHIGSSTSSPTESIDAGGGVASYRALATTFVRGTIMSALDWLLIRRSAWDRGVRKLRDDLKTLIAELREAGAGEIIVLSVFPTISPRINLHRRAVRRIMLELVAANEFTFVDVWPALARGRGIFLLPRRGTLLDTVHLNLTGHKRIAEVLEQLRSRDPSAAAAKTS